jgi:signal transduction histidine kinase
LRAGIDELLTRNDLPAQVYDQLSALLHQTYRITSVVDDLLLLSRMDAGRLQIQYRPVNLSALIEEWADDFSVLRSELDIKLETDFPPGLHVAGEKRYITLIVQNLIENAQKYNVPGGRICIYAREQGEFVVLGVENTGRAIPRAAQAHIFERFHRGGMGENVPGHGLGLNLARELARLHGGDLRLTKSDSSGTEFEVRFRRANRACRRAGGTLRQFGCMRRVSALALFVVVTVATRSTRRISSRTSATNSRSARSTKACARVSAARSTSSITASNSLHRG